MGEWDATEKRAHRAEAERDAALAQLADRDARLAAIGKLHGPHARYLELCGCCYDERPCPTERALRDEARMSAPEPVDVAVLRRLGDECVSVASKRFDYKIHIAEAATIGRAASEIERLRAELAAERAVVAAVHGVTRYDGLRQPYALWSDLMRALATKPSPPPEETHP